MAPVGIAVIGCGRIGESHIDGVRQNPDLARLAAVADVDPVRAADTGTRHAVRAYTSVAEVLGDPTVDAVVVCVPNDQHAPVTRAAAEAGKHVLVEKPFAADPTEARAMVETCERAGVTLMGAQSRRYIRALQEARRRRSEIGRRLHVVYTIARHYDKTNAPVWYRSIRQTSGLAIAIFGAHAVDFSLWYMDDKKPVSVFAASGEFHKDFEGPDECTIIIRFDDGSLATHVLSMNGRQQRHECYIIGSAGTMFFTHGGNEVYEGIRSPATDLYVNGNLEMTGNEGPHNFAVQLREFASAIQERREPMSSGREMLANLTVLEAAKVSALRGAPIQLAGFAATAYPR